MKRTSTAAVLSGLLAAAAPVAHAGEGVTDLRMELEGRHLPLWSVDLGIVGDDIVGWSPRLAASFRGFGPDGALWGAVDGEIWAFHEPRRLDASITLFRSVGETWPTPIGWDLGVLVGRLQHDTRLDVGLDASVSLFRAAGALYFPSVDAGDFDGKFVGAIDLLGAHHRRYATPHKPFLGARLGGLEGELTVGARLGDDTLLRLTLLGEADWSLGQSARTAVVTDSRTAAALCLHLGPVPVCAVGANDTTRDPGNALARTSYSARFEMGLAP